jgi:iron complex outermembrane receptor protein
MLNMKRNVLSMALASAVVMLPQTAHADAGMAAQQTLTAEEEAKAEEAAELDVIEVTGIRRGIENAIETKQSSTSIVEAISAEDIGKLPDLSIADSIARLPGLTAQRDRGRASEINIRGFAGDFSTTTLNGREQVSLGNNRGVEFDQYPAELVNQVVVYKTPDASLIGQGLSGTVDLQTVRPLNFSERVIAVNARLDQSRLAGEKDNGNRFSLSYVDQYADNTIGLALGYARLNNPTQGHQFEAWGYDGNGLLGGGKLYDFENENTRDGLMAAVEFRPSDSYSSIVDFYYSKFDKEELKRGMESGTATFVSGTRDPGTGTYREASFTGFDPVMRNDFNGAEDELLAFGWNQEFKLGDSWTLRTDLSRSDAKRDERILETYAGFPAGVSDAVSIRFNPDGYFDFDLGLDYADPNNFRLIDAGGWGQDGYVKDFEVEDTLTSARVDFERSFEAGAISSMEFGFNIADREKSRASNENFLCLQTCGDGASAPIPAGLLTSSSFGFAGLGGLLGYDARGALETAYRLRGNFNIDIANKNWEVDERVTTLFFQANVMTEIGSMPLTGNFGIQAADTDQSSSGFRTYNGNSVGEAFDSGADYRNYLPSMNLSLAVTDDQTVRFAAGRQLARARMDQLRANESYRIDIVQPPEDAPDQSPRPEWRGDGGNPELKPWVANAFDVSYEKYFGGRGYFSVAWFHKDLRTYIYDQTLLYDFTGFEVPAGATAIPASPIGEVVRPANGEGGTLKGFEYALSVPFDMLWEPLQGFGLQASYTDSSTSIRPDGPDSPATQLPGFSKYTSNVTLYFERWGFSTRASRRSRSEFLGEVQGFGGDRSRIFFEGEAVVDLQLGYQIQSGMLKDLTFLFQVNNLTDEPFASNFDQIEDRPRQFFEYGRNYLLGMNYRF